MKKKLIFIFLPILMICLLTGCCYQHELVLHSSGLPEGTRACILAKSGSNIIPKELKDTEIGNYSEDGWHYEDLILSGRENIKEYGSIKVAVYDDKGRIVKISPEFPLVIKGKCYYWDSFNYDFDTNEVSGESTDYMGDEVADTINNLGLLLLDIICFIIFMIVIGCMKHYRDYPLYLLLNIPNLIIILWTGLWTFCDYFQAPDKKPNSEENLPSMLVFIGFVCLVNLFGFIRYRRLRKIAKSKAVSGAAGKE